MISKTPSNSICMILLSQKPVAHGDLRKITVIEDNPPPPTHSSATKRWFWGVSLVHQISSTFLKVTANKYLLQVKMCALCLNEASTLSSSS